MPSWAARSSRCLMRPVNPAPGWERLERLLSAIRSGAVSGVVLDFELKPAGSVLTILLALNQICEPRPKIVLLVPEVRLPFQLWQSLGVIESYLVKPVALASVLETLAQAHRPGTSSISVPRVRDVIAKAQLETK